MCNPNPTRIEPRAPVDLGAFIKKSERTTPCEGPRIRTTHDKSQGRRGSESGRSSNMSPAPPGTAEWTSAALRLATAAAASGAVRAAAQTADAITCQEANAAW